MPLDPVLPYVLSPAVHPIVPISSNLMPLAAPSSQGLRPLPVTPISSQLMPLTSIPSQGLGPLPVVPISSQIMPLTAPGPAPLVPPRPLPLTPLPLTPPKPQPIQNQLPEVPPGKQLAAAPYAASPMLIPPLPDSVASYAAGSMAQCPAGQFECNVNGMTVVQSPMIKSSYVLPMYWNTSAYSVPRGSNMMSCLKK